LHADLGDEAGRRGLASLLVTLVRHDATSPLLLPHLLRVLRRLHRDEAGYVRIILELLADIRDPLEAEMSDEARDDRQKLEVNLSKIS
jgi:hypothetical protein